MENISLDLKSEILIRNSKYTIQYENNPYLQTQLKILSPSHFRGESC